MYKKKLLKYSLAFFLLLFFKSVSAQVEGVVTDSITNKPIPFAHIFWADTDIGVYSDIDGNFMLPELENGELIEVSCIGYVMKSMHRESIDTIVLTPISTVLKPVEIYGNDDFEEMTLGFKKKTGGKGTVSMILKNEPIPNSALRIIAEIYNPEDVEMIMENLKFYLDIKSWNPRYLAMRVILSEMGPSPDSPGELLYNSNIFMLQRVRNGRNLINFNMLKFHEVVIPKEGIHCQILFLALLDKNYDYAKGRLKGVISRHQTQELKAYITTNLHNKAILLYKNRKDLFYNYSIWVEALVELEE